MKNLFFHCVLLLACGSCSAWLAHSVFYGHDTLVILQCVMMFFGAVCLALFALWSLLRIIEITYRRIRDNYWERDI